MTNPPHPSTAPGAAYIDYGQGRGVVLDPHPDELQHEQAIARRTKIRSNIERFAPTLDTEIEFAFVLNNDPKPWEPTNPIYVFTDADRSGWWAIAESSWRDIHLAEPVVTSLWSIDVPGGGLRETQIVGADEDGEIVIVIMPLRGDALADQIESAADGPVGEEPNPFGVDQNVIDHEPALLRNAPVVALSARGGSTLFRSMPVLHGDGTPTPFVVYRDRVYHEPVLSMDTGSGPGFIYSEAGHAALAMGHRRPGFMNHRTPLPAHTPETVEALLESPAIAGVHLLASHASADEERGVPAMGLDDGILGKPPFSGFILSEEAAEAYLFAWNLGAELRQVATRTDDGAGPLTPANVLTDDEIRERFDAYDIPLDAHWLADWRKQIIDRAGATA